MIKGTEKKMQSVMC